MTATNKYKDLVDGKYEYFAFISYKEEDADWAKWLQRMLENYKLPIALRKDNPELPERIRPIYEYKSDAGGGRLKEVIWKGLTSSKYLIVICSPRATKSRWINDGINYFIESNNERNIIPFIIDGKPKSIDPAEECFPSALLELKGERELRGININEGGREAAAVKIISQMLNLKFAKLWSRYEIDQRRQRRNKIGLILGFISILAIASLIFSFVVSNKNSQLDDKNNQLIEERNKVIESNIALTRSNTRAVANEVNKLIDEGNINMAIRVALNVLPDSCNEWPYVPEAEFVLRKAADSLLVNHWHSECVLEHALPINTAGFSPNGDYVLTASNDNLAKLWNAKDGTLLFDPIEHPRLVNCATFSPDGCYFATGCRDNHVRIYATKSGELLRTVKINGNVWSLTYSPDGNYLVCSSNGGLSFYSVSRGEIVAVLGRQSTVCNNSFTTDGHRFAWNIGNHVMVAETEKMISEFYPKLLKCKENNTEDLIWSYLDKELSFHAILESDKQCKYSFLSHDGSRMGIVTFDSLSYLYDTKNNSMLQSSSQVLYSCFSPDGNYWVNALNEGKAYVYESQNGIYNGIELNHDSAILYCNFSHDGKLFVTTSLDKTVKIWNVENNWELVCILQHDRPVVSVEFNKNVNSIVCVQNNNVAKIWSIPTPLNRQIKLFIINAYPTFVSFNSSSDKLLYSSMDRTISEWNILDGTLNFQSDYYASKVISAEYSHDDKMIVAAFDDGTIRLLDEKGNDKNIYIKHKDFLYSAHFSPDNRYVLSASADSTAIVWDANNGKKVYPIMKHSSRVINAFFLDSERVLTATADSLYIRNIKTGRSLSQTKIGNGTLQYVAVSPNSQIIAACDDNNQVHIWHNQDINQKPILFYHGGLQLGNINELYCDMQKEVEQNDTTWLKSTISGTVLGSELYRILSHKSAVNSLSFTADSKYLITDSENCIKIWDTSSGILVADGIRHPWRIQYSKMSPTGEMIASIANDNDYSFLTIWKYKPLEQLISFLKSRFKDWRLTDEEQRKYYLK